MGGESSGASATAVMNVVERCPSGALQYAFSNGARSERPSRPGAVTVVPDGPLQLRGDVVSTQVRMPPRSNAARDSRYCRCGASQRKPFCDGSPRCSGFPRHRCRGAAGVKPGDADAVGGVQLHVQVRTDGPLRVQGDLQVIDGAGQMAWHGPIAVLCRCGQSASRPFCDGTHKRIGFRAE
ncbi:MAG: CDGSH iron-sulfur domain-containing protein [Burkholderiales bacterium]|nr:CDGSH iron-sulfur domain-containing protein [Burkholderiales bacterium]